MTTNYSSKKVTIVGAGLSGSLMAIYLARRGFQVNLYERREHFSGQNLAKGRSFNVTLAERGLSALEQVGLKNDIMPLTVPIKGRMVHDLDGKSTFHPYSHDGTQELYCISRHKLNEALWHKAQSFHNVTTHFCQKCVQLDKSNNQIWLRGPSETELTCVQSDLIIGADGAFSTVRQQMLRGERADYQQDFLDWGYKQLIIPAGPNGKFLMEPNALHIWPRGNCMFFALPNLDGSFTGNLIMPFEGETSLASLHSEADMRAFFQAQFSDVVSLIPQLSKKILASPASYFITIRTSQWHYKDRIALIGDACHAVVPFYGQGMNAGFEDCPILDDCLTRYASDWEMALAEYQARRKPHTDVLADLSKQNFIELRDKVRSPTLIARKKVEQTLNWLFPKRWHPLHIMISHTSVPYADALAHYRRQSRLARFLGADIFVLLMAAFLAGKASLKSVSSIESQEQKKKVAPITVSGQTES